MYVAVLGLHAVAFAGEVLHCGAHASFATEGDMRLVQLFQEKRFQRLRTRLLCAKLGFYILVGTIAGMGVVADDRHRGRAKAQSSALLNQPRKGQRLNAWRPHTYTNTIAHACM